MTRRKRHALLWSVRLAAVLALLGGATPALAQVSLWADMWPASEDNGDGTVTLYGVTSATADTVGDLYLQGSMEGPGGQLDADGTYCWCTFIDLNMSANVSLSSPEGEYKTNGAAQFNGEHYGCALQIGGVSIGNWYYQYLYEESSTFARYARCNPGICDPARVRHSYFGAVEGWPPYARLSILSITVGPFRNCFAVGAFITGGCYPD